jgi:hypothetical protein
MGVTSKPAGLPRNVAGERGNGVAVWVAMAAVELAICWRIYWAT